MATPVRHRAVDDAGMSPAPSQSRSYADRLFRTALDASARVGDAVTSLLSRGGDRSPRTADDAAAPYADGAAEDTPAQHRASQRAVSRMQLSPLVAGRDFRAPSTSAAPPASPPLTGATQPPATPAFAGVVPPAAAGPQNTTYVYNFFYGVSGVPAPLMTPQAAEYPVYAAPSRHPRLSSMAVSPAERVLEQSRHSAARNASQFGEPSLGDLSAITHAAPDTSIRSWLPRASVARVSAKTARADAADTSVAARRPPRAETSKSNVTFNDTLDVVQALAPDTPPSGVARPATNDVAKAKSPTPASNPFAAKSAPVAGDAAKSAAPNPFGAKASTPAPAAAPAAKAPFGKPAGNASAVGFDDDGFAPNAQDSGSDDEGEQKKKTQPAAAPANPFGAAASKAPTSAPSNPFGAKSPTPASNPFAAKSAPVAGDAAKSAAPNPFGAKASTPAPAAATNSAFGKPAGGVGATAPLSSPFGTKTVNPFAAKP